MSFSKLNVVSYNQGTNIADYDLLCRHNKIETKVEDYEISQNKTAKYFYELAQRRELDVVLLQEVGDESRPLIKSLTLADFETFHILNNQNTPQKILDRGVFDCAILLKKDRFTAIENRSMMIKGYDTPIVLTTDKETNQRMLFVSAHIPGCILDQGRIMKADARDGDNVVQNIVNEISAIDGSAIQIIGADMNANPEKLDADQPPERKWAHRFNILENAGFQTFRTNLTTEVFPKSATYPERELDFIFARETPKLGFMQKIMSSILRTTPVFKEKGTSVLLNFGLDKKEQKNTQPINASDHRPIMTEFLVEKLS